MELLIGIIAGTIAGLGIGLWFGKGVVVNVQRYEGAQQIADDTPIKPCFNPDDPVEEEIRKNKRLEEMDRRGNV